MTMSNGNMSDLTESLFRENEIKANRVTTKAMAIWGLLLIIMSILDMMGIYQLASLLARYLLLVFGFINIVAFLIARRVHYEHPKLKSLIIGCTLFSCGVSFFFYPTTSTFITYGAIIIAAMYYNQRLIRITALCSWLLYSLLLFANVYFEQTSETIRMLHAIQEIKVWRWTFDVVNYYFIPHTVLFLITTLICDSIARRGQNLVRKRAMITSEVTSMERDLKTAFDIQLQALPAPRYETSVGHLKFDAFIRPAKVVGGDFYDYFICGPNVVFLVADVSDKGMPAALFMMKAKYAIRSAVMNCSSLEKAISEANEVLCDNNMANMFVTLWIASINMKTGVGKYVNCGHLPPVIRHADGSVERIENEPNVMLGVFEKPVLSSHIIRLKKDDRLFLFTDGLTDAVNADGQQFGNENLLRAITLFPSDSTSCCATLIGFIDSFTAGQSQFDDMTLMVVRPIDERTSECYEFLYDANYESVEKLIKEVNILLEGKFCPDAARRDMDAALDEICGNVSDYAYEDGKTGKLRLNLTLGDNYAEFLVCDNGKPFNPLEVSDPKDFDHIETGGIGIFLAKKLMDSLDYSYAEGENRLRMMKVWH